MGGMPPRYDIDTPEDFWDALDDAQRHSYSPLHFSFMDVHQDFAPKFLDFFTNEDFIVVVENVILEEDSDRLQQFFVTMVSNPKGEDDESG
jgi:hypothetical protein